MIIYNAVDIYVYMNEGAIRPPTIGEILILKDLTLQRWALKYHKVVESYGGRVVPDDPILKHCVKQYNKRLEQLEVPRTKYSEYHKV